MTNGPKYQRRFWEYLQATTNNDKEWCSDLFINFLSSRFYVRFNDFPVKHKRNKTSSTSIMFQMFSFFASIPCSNLAVSSGKPGWSFRWCTFRFLRSINSFPHNEHLKGRIMKWWCLTWALRFPGLLNTLWHLSQVLFTVLSSTDLDLGPWQVFRDKCLLRGLL